MDSKLPVRDSKVVNELLESFKRRPEQKDQLERNAVCDADYVEDNQANGLLAR